MFILIKVLATVVTELLSIALSRLILFAIRTRCAG